MRIRIRLAALALIVVSTTVRAGAAPDAFRRMADGKLWTARNLDVALEQSYCYADVEANCRRYGRLYTWESARRGCQSLGDGWRLPTDNDWRELVTQYGGAYEEKRRDGQAAFTALLIGGRSGFDALLGGNRDPGTGQYARREEHGFYWTASATPPANAAFYNFGKGSHALYRQPSGSRQMAISVRCVRD